MDVTATKPGKASVPSNDKMSNLEKGVFEFSGDQLVEGSVK